MKNLFQIFKLCFSPRSLCVVVDSLSCTDSSIRAAAQCWLARALSLSDVIRILEPILLLLLHPSTQCCSIQSVKQNVTAGKRRLQAVAKSKQGDFQRWEVAQYKYIVTVFKSIFQVSVLC